MKEALSSEIGRSILIVDDIPANLAVAVEYLEANDFQVMVAQDGEEGLERAQLVRPDLILLDVMMPGMDGFETCRLLKSIDSTRDIPVIFMTALADSSDKVKGFAAGAVDFISKPFQVEELLARIETHLTLRAVQQKLAKQNAQLHESESRYRRLFETAKDGIFLLDFDSGKITDVNLSLIQMLGYRRDHYIGQKLCDIAPFKDIPACRDGLTDLSTGTLRLMTSRSWTLSLSVTYTKWTGPGSCNVTSATLPDGNKQRHASATWRFMTL